MGKTSKTNHPKSPANSVRLVIQIIFLVVVILIGLRHIMPGESSKGGAFDAFCPFGAIETLWSFASNGRTLPTTSLLNFSILFGVLGVSLLAGRAFCGWMCPLGTLQDLLADLASRVFSTKGSNQRDTILRFPIRISEKNTRWLRSLKYLVLAVILIASVWSVYPPLREICPARAFFSFELQTPILWSVLITFIATSMLNRRVWCKFLCPFGAVLVPFNKIAPLRLVSNPEKCPGCMQCDAACPMDIKDVPENLRSPECIQCLDCQERCPDQDALTLRMF